MRSTRLRTLAGLVLTAVVASCADAPTGVSAKGTRPVANQTTPLAVNLVCFRSGNLYCEAYAGGGSGWYSFEWQGAWEVTDDSEGHSESLAVADRYCSDPFDLPIVMSVVVTDSNNQTVSAQYSFSCYYW